MNAQPGSTPAAISPAYRPRHLAVLWRRLCAASFCCLLAMAAPVWADSPDGLEPIGRLGVDINPPAGEMPEDFGAIRFAQAGVIEHRPGASRGWPLGVVAWEAPASCHAPLYFEEPNLERFGYSRGLAQPLVSGAHFFGTIAALPYLMAAEPPCERVYTLGRGRPGSYNPYRIQYPPLDRRGVLAEAGVVTGLIFLIP